MGIDQSIDNALSVKLNIARAGAAFLVTIGHIRNTFFTDWNHLTPDSHNIINYILWCLTRLGFEAVIVFFVLSGYLVGGSLISNVVNEKPLWVKYLVDRLVRLWMVLIPALLIGAVCDIYTIYLNPAVPGADRITLNVFFGNLVFLQTILVQPFGTNIPLWSLAYEFWYYMIWPVLLVFATIKMKIPFRVVLILILFVILYLIIPEIIKLYPIWIAGALVRVINFKKLFLNKITLLFAIAFCIGCFIFSSLATSTFRYYLLASSVLIVILHWKNGIHLTKNIDSKLPHFFSEFSFSLYATHYFFMFLILETTRTIFDLKEKFIKADFSTWLIISGMSILICGLSWIFYYFTERHTFFVRKKVYNGIQKFKNQPF